VVFIRRSGCQLPIEVFAPPHEPIPPAIAAELAALGNVTVRSLADALPAAAHDNMQQRKFLAKQLAILVSSFQEVLFLDSDNLPLRDPTFLFEEPLYTQHGLLMWPDFWRSEVKPGAWEALGIPPALRPAGSHESGQVVIDKARAWRPLLLAIYLNMRGDVFYPLLSDHGQGDKETLAVAWLASVGEQYGLVSHGVNALGYITEHKTFDGTAMLQSSPDGAPLFLHGHMPKITVPKHQLQLPPPLGSGRRSWVILANHHVKALPPGLDTAQFKGNLDSYEMLNAVAGCDIEVEVLQLRRYLRCQPAWVECCLA
jgi:alpha 1,2-mannosyltransferase